MSKITWNESFSVGVNVLDEQHHKIIDLINRFVEQESEAFDREILETVLSELIEYGFEHLKLEEAMLEENDYPDFQKHKHEHLLYVQKITQSAKRKKSLSEEEFIELGEFLNQWWTDHILEEDMKYRPFFESKNIS
jgi:hemerythrin-like metal-binding protein